MSSSRKALLIVDLQVDFCPGGLYPVPDGDKTVQPMNYALAFARENGWKLYASRDWHPKHLFENNHYDAHCVQETRGANYHPNLNIDTDVEIISKGEIIGDDHFSAFNGDEKSLEDLMKKDGVKQVYIGGLATEYCIKYSALDSAKRGFKTYVFEDAIRHIDQAKADAAFKAMKAAGISIIKTTDLR